ncbi:serine/threonine-protein kinase [Streptococcus iniae]|uniref:serine/threonine-protein kinase n=1 Tax=Streptococcus iniae TaxID=1346 RepID=UPI002B2EDA14|nr:serine/threonine-protein kinase [Streptococcus iniae]WNZ92861.1 serine/threonine-protein kinase [Streptococcus iniae]
MAKITFHDKTIIKNFFNEGGYVLDFSNRTFDEFTYHSIGVKIQEKYGLSKGKSFEAYIDEATDEDLIKLVKDLLTYYDDLPDNSSEKNDIKNKQAEKLKEKINAYTHIGEEIVKADESFLTKGGFADIYLQKHTQRIVKKLKNEYKQDSALKSRFKREFEIMQSLSQVNGIIKVYVFDESEFSYTMEKADFTLNDYIGTNDLEMYQIFNLLFQILTIMSEVHSRDIIHRDLSPTNIFLCNGLIKISDFGLAKDSTANHSHLTVNTNNYGQFYYCAPEQISGLKNSTKMSDVYSLGKVVNFCLTGNPTNEKHVLRTFVQKATSYQPELRFRDAEEMLEQLSHHLNFFHQKDSKQKIFENIQNREYDETITVYLNNISDVDLCQDLIEIGRNYKLACINFMKISPENAQFLMQKTFPSMKEVATSFSSNDIFASLAFDVLKDERFDYLSKEIVARILYYVAREVNRFYAQRLIEDLKRSSIEPMLENILDGK